MFKQIGQIASLLKNAPKIKEEMAKLQSRLGELTAEGDAGAGMVKVQINGRFEILRCTISEDALSDKEMLEDLIRSATNQALEKIRALIAEETNKAASGLGLPAMPDITGMMGS